MADINYLVQTQRANWACWQTEKVFADALADLSDFIGGQDVPDDIWRPIEQAIYALGTWTEDNADLLKAKYSKRQNERS